VKRWKRRSLLWWGFLLVILGAAALLRQVDQWTFRYAAMPPTDDALRQALADSPRLAGVEVSQDQAAVHVRYNVSFWRALGQGGFPTREFMEACERAGYKDFQGFQETSHGTWSH
jgi:hypothetical protein